MKTFIILLVLSCCFIAHARGACTCSQYNECSCFTSLPYPFAQSATINITYFHGMLSFQQIFGKDTVNTFTFQGSNLSPQGAVCVATQEVGWCVLLENFNNNGQYSSGTITSTLVKLGTVWTGNHGTFKIANTGSSVTSVRDGPPPAAQLCNNQCNSQTSQECNCKPGSGCYCCTNKPINTCTQLAGIPMFQNLQSTVVFGGSIWFMASSQVANPESLCTVNAQVSGTLCLFFTNLNFGQSSISGNAYTVFTNQNSSNETSLGYFRITSQ